MFHDELSVCELRIHGVSSCFDAEFRAAWTHSVCVLGLMVAHVLAVDAARGTVAVCSVHSPGDDDQHDNHGDD